MMPKPSGPITYTVTKGANVSSGLLQGLLVLVCVLLGIGAFWVWAP